jgi:hypothetical protein
MAIGMIGTIGIGTAIGDNQPTTVNDPDFTLIWSNMNSGCEIWVYFKSSQSEIRSSATRATGSNY